MVMEEDGAELLIQPPAVHHLFAARLTNLLMSRTAHVVPTGARAVRTDGVELHHVHVHSALPFPRAPVTGRQRMVKVVFGQARVRQVIERQVENLAVPGTEEKRLPLLWPFSRSAILLEIVEVGLRVDPTSVVVNDGLICDADFIT
jgi:hypothetical protein